MVAAGRYTTSVPSSSKAMGSTRSSSPGGPWPAARGKSLRDESGQYVAGSYRSDHVDQPNGWPGGRNFDARRSVRRPGYGECPLGGGVRFDHIAIAVDDEDRRLVGMEEVPIASLGVQMGHLRGLGDSPGVPLGGNPLSDQQCQGVEQDDLGEFGPSSLVAVIVDSREESRYGQNGDPSGGEHGSRATRS